MTDPTVKRPELCLLVIKHWRQRNTNQVTIIDETEATVESIQTEDESQNDDWSTEVKTDILAEAFSLVIKPVTDKTDGQNNNTVENIVWKNLSFVH